MAINVKDFTYWISRDWINEPFVVENKVAVFTAIAIIALWLVIWIVWKIIKYIDGRKIREYHSNGPLDKIIDRKIDQLAK